MKIIKLDQMSLALAMMKEVTKKCLEAGVTDDVKMWQMNALVEGANIAIAGFNREEIPSRPDSGLEAWLASDDTGMSSKYMAFIMAQGPCVEYAHPHDPDDLGRCLRFLESVPEAVQNITLMKTQSSVWNCLVDKWYHFSNLYSQGKGNELYEEMKSIGC